MIGCTTFGKEAIGFALPIFSHQTETHKVTIQEVDEVTGRITSFRSLEQTDFPSIRANGPSLMVGDKPIYAFFSTAEDVHVGTLDILRPMLEKVAEDSSSRQDLVLQIRELIGSADEKKIARVRMQRQILKEHGIVAARSFYEGSVLQSVMWSCLLSTTTNERMARRILKARPSLSATITSTGKITLDLLALSEQDRAAIDSSKLLTMILLEFDPEPNNRPTAILADNSYAPDIRRNTEVLLDQISLTKRQEERVAVLLSAILDNPLVGKSAILQYQTDKAKFADWAVKEIRQLLLNTDWSSDERIVASLVPRFFARQYPMSRGDLLFFLAKHLGKWPLVREAIRGSLKKTQSLFVSWRRTEIEGELLRHDRAEPFVRTQL